jgi:hypothetical protein
VSVSLVRQSTRADTGFVSVSVPKGTSNEGVGFRVPLPVGVADVANSDAGAPMIEMRAVINGRSQALPSWLRYSSALQMFVATAVPDGGLPITIEISSAGRVTLMVISERSN